MDILHLDNGVWVDVYSETDTNAGSSVIITNSSSSCVYLDHDGETSINDGFPLYPEQSALIHGNSNKNVYAKGHDSEIVVQKLTSTITPFIGVEFPQYVYTSDSEQFRRLRVDNSNTAFHEGREFRSFYDFDITADEIRIIKASIATDMILRKFDINLVAGQMRIELYKGGTVTGGTVTPLTPIPKNTMSFVPTVTPQNRISVYDNAATFDDTNAQLIDVYKFKSIDSGNKSFQIVGDLSDDQRGVGVDDYHYVITTMGTQDSDGVIRAFWDEVDGMVS